MYTSPVNWLLNIQFDQIVKQASAMHAYIYIYTLLLCSYIQEPAKRPARKRAPITLQEPLQEQDSPELFARDQYLVEKLLAERRRVGPGHIVTISNYLPEGLKELCTVERIPTGGLLMGAV